MKGSQNKKIKAVMEGNYSSMVGESMSKRFNGAIVGFLGGVILGALLRQNALIIGAVGGVIGYVVGNKNAPLT